MRAMEIFRNHQNCCMKEQLLQVSTEFLKSIFLIVS